jgi:protein tyrosine/serine phosphatase
MVQDAATLSWFFFFLVVTQLEAFVVPSTPSSCRLLLPSLNAVSLVTGDSCSVNSVKNLRPVVPGSTLYRSATLDELTEEDAERLLSGSAFDINNEDSKTRKPLASVIDLRNADEISKGEKVRTKGSKLFYDSPDVEFLTIPVLGNVDVFWEEAIATMDAKERMMATLQTVVSGGALDRAAAKHLERGGLPLLYAIMMKTGGRPLASALEACMTDSGSVIFHCQKGKDRTGVLAMLLQTCLQSNSIDDNDAEIVDAYALSGELLGELPNQSKDSDDSSSSTSIIDWSYFRGSPAEAMKETLAWTRQQYGSVEGYLDSISFGEEKRVRLRGYNQK